MCHYWPGFFFFLNWSVLAVCAFKALKGKSEQSLQRLIIREVFFWKWISSADLKLGPKDGAFPTWGPKAQPLKTLRTHPFSAQLFLFCLPHPHQYPACNGILLPFTHLIPNTWGIYPVSRKEVSMDCPISLNNSCYLSTLCKALYSFYTLSPLILTIAQWDGYYNYSSFYR